MTPLEEGLDEDGRVGAGRTAPGASAPFDEHRGDEEPARSVARDMKAMSRRPPATTTSTCPRIRPARWSGRVIAEYLRPWVPPEAHVLEIGAGYCCWINAVQAARRVAVDSWADMPRHAAAGVEAVVLDASTGLTPIRRRQPSTSCSPRT